MQRRPLGSGLWHERRIQPSWVEGLAQQIARAITTSPTHSADPLKAGLRLSPFWLNHFRLGGHEGRYRVRGK